ncbi:sorbosone dehydrogenase family protein [Glaciimonas sp. PAMC28666]|uniref:PQQ-dependent sugar dehydrogenase n=1 Tax=Glaciimonas sp. PAMC28666 TaxID=2807626 RepID=UPI0019635F10|nr:PQQ-dependent sugar dehydrogenase [Glaciimonas sp. PAMC28666]QRX81637.1 PQQ-dependent sugar dehydrogenase [Glaciimonas sp. PAMC28666]
MSIRNKLLLVSLLTSVGAAVFAQTSPAPAAAPAWAQGMPADLANSTLHPIASILIGRSASELPIEKLKVPPGFKVEVWADGIPDARSLALGTKGTVFVSNRGLSNVYAVIDHDGKREVKTILKGLNSPNGLAFADGTLYVAERERIVAYAGIEDNLDNPPAPRVIVDGLPEQPGHFWKVLTTGPDGKLYFNIGSPQNITMPNYIQAAILRVDPKTGVVEDVARGVRNSVGMAFNPRTKKLWFTSNARDWMGNQGPEDVLETVTKVGEHFGFPFCHQGTILDPTYGKNRSCAEFTPPSMLLGAHVAPLGMRFYTGKSFPAAYRNDMFIALHGSWNREEKQGYRVDRVHTDAKGHLVKEVFLDGFMTDARADPPMWGRPVDVLVMNDGALLVSDDYNGVVYRVSYVGK